MMSTEMGVAGDVMMTSTEMGVEGGVVLEAGGGMMIMGVAGGGAPEVAVMVRDVNWNWDGVLYLGNSVIDI